MGTEILPPQGCGKGPEEPGRNPLLGVALPFHLTWMECLGTLTPSTSITRWGTGPLESQGPRKEMGSESSRCLACPVPGKGLRGHPHTFPPCLSWREERRVCPFCPSLLLQSQRGNIPGGGRGLRARGGGRAPMPSGLTSFPGWAALVPPGLLPRAPDFLVSISLYPA